MDCRSVSDADRVCDWCEGVQCPNDRKPIFFMRGAASALEVSVSSSDETVGSPSKAHPRIVLKADAILVIQSIHLCSSMHFGRRDRRPIGACLSAQLALRAKMADQVERIRHYLIGLAGACRY